MMGLQATSAIGAAAGGNKRKLDGESATTPHSLDSPTPVKNGRWDTAADDCIARLRAVAVPAADVWRAPTPSLAATLLTSTDDEFDDDEFEDELSSDEDRFGATQSSITPVPEQFPKFLQHQTYNR